MAHFKFKFNGNSIHIQFQSGLAADQGPNTTRRSDDGLAFPYERSLGGVIGEASKNGRTDARTYAHAHTYIKRSLHILWSMRPWPWVCVLFFCLPLVGARVARADRGGAPQHGTSWD